MEPENSDTYSDEIQQLLNQYSWLFNFKMTNIFTENVLDDVPSEWLEFGQKATVEVLHAIAEGNAQDNWPPELASFVRLCGRLRRWQRRRGSPPSERPLPATMTRGISAKKRHELSRMVPAVRRLCSQADSRLVMDVGAGVGHLAECLRQASELRVLGLEQSAPLVEGADRRRQQLSAAGAAGCPACLRVVRCHVSDSEAGQHQLQQLAADFGAERCSCGSAAAVQQPARWCLTGLHCCGDLAPQLLRLLLRLPEARALLLLSCCFHKAADGLLLSRRLAAARLGPFGRRLACQQSVAAWCRQTAAEHGRHAAATGWRALLQVVAERTGRAVCDRRRHGTHRYASFAEYAAGMLEPDDERRRTDGGDQLPTVAAAVSDQYAPQLRCVEFLAALQACLQPVLEGLLLLDRMFFLREHALSAELVPLFDDRLSPRAWALMAWKN